MGLTRFFVIGMGDILCETVGNDFVEFRWKFWQRFAAFSGCTLHGGETLDTKSHRLSCKLFHRNVFLTTCLPIQLFQVPIALKSQLLQSPNCLSQVRNGALFYTLSGAPSHALHYEVPYEVPVYSRISFIQIGIVFHTFWYVSCCSPAKRCSAVPGGPREETRLPHNEITKLPQCNV